MVGIIIIIIHHQQQQPQQHYHQCDPFSTLITSPEYHTFMVD